MYYAIATKVPFGFGSSKPYKITPELHEFESRAMRDRWVQSGNSRLKDSRQTISIRDIKSLKCEYRPIRHSAMK